MIRVGLTGGIAAGKSAVAQRLAQFGAVLIDADQLARVVVEPGSAGLAAVVDSFGPEVLDADGSLDRAALGAVVFGDVEARRRLEAIVHPLVRAAAQRLEDAAVASNPDAVVVHDIPLLVETGQSGPDSRFDLVVVVDASQERQLQRLVADRGLDPDHAQNRIDAQVARAERIAAADVVLDNDGTLAELMSQVDRLWVDRLGGSG